jgi:glycosyltransferase involved in cell wall biosynthesis
MTQTVGAVVGNSRFILERHLKFGYFKASRIREVVFNAYPGNASPAPPSAPRHKPLRLGYLGRVKPNKGVELLLRVMETLQSDRYELYLGGQDEMGLRNKNRMAHVHFLGFVKPEEFFPKIDVLVVPSLWQDPLPRTIFEAYAFGIPVVGSRRGGIPEAIDDGKTGFLFDADHPETLAASIENVASDWDNLERMKRHALEKSKAFRPSLMVSRYLGIYRSVAESRP